jgi:hypothetical protein
MKFAPLKLIFLFFCLVISKGLLAQSVVDAANLGVENPNGAEGIFSETIKIISSSKKIFILTNNNQQLNPGDFISLALEDKLAARAVVAKVHQGQVGIKILKIYSLAQWGKLKRDSGVQIIKGDDSQFGKKPKVEETPNEIAKDAPRIREEEDLYKMETEDEDFGSLDENKSRHLRPDNLLSVSGSYLEVAEVSPGTGKIRKPVYGIGWAYQFTDNYFIEGVYGRSLINNFPSDGSSTLVNQMTARIKYNIKGPLYSYFMPYLGYMFTSVVSPDAGKKSTNPSIIKAELDAINNLKKSTPVFGVTVLRRLVPGWFIKADLGSDIVNVGFAIEF